MNHECNTCHTKFKKESNYIKHINMKSCVKLFCDKCKKDFKTARYFRDHQKKECVFPCNKCHKSFGKEILLNKHKCETNECNNCHKVFANKSNLLRHTENQICNPKRPKPMKTTETDNVKEEEIHKLQELLKFYKLHYETSLEQNKLMIMREMKAYEMYFVNKKLTKANIYELFSVINYFHSEKNYTVLAKIMAKIQVIDNADIALEEILLLRLMKGTIAEQDDFRTAYPYLLKMIKDDKRKKSVMDTYKKYNTIEPIKALL